ncbi:soluble scavenger receptor cysteine-rich domain-containing protein SSC5D-like isoform X1 [Lytechinus variegatus]|uniref:soluble scavenger receptor cysteine-rich domain-containing protein SSC5D-like isoform X1 n=1 Tax=Lytechinus variegatus TaxID=7654 RepID=UPI001BB10772|nr:soluble scavenger receptor cysteine-rich domain-containing protein SSC5D-like isoform X1 [Lytechinus variegatus]
MDGDIRLVDGSDDINLYEGRLEIFHNFQWGTVCAQEPWTMSEVTVACQQLGRIPLEATRRFGPGRDAQGIFLDDVDCTGLESTLIDCQSRGWGVHDCTHWGDVGLVCGSEAQSEGALRLVGGSSALEGRLEIYHNYEWGTICDDYFDLADADVACRQLGYISAQAVKERAYYGAASSSVEIWLDNVDCTGNEGELRYCSSRGWGVENCGHNEDVGIVCRYTTASEGDLRLVDGEDLDEGRVEIYHNGVWGTICNDYWAYDEARVACRQLGYYGVSYSKTSMYGPGTGPIHLDNVMCYGYEDRLLQCYNLDWDTTDCVHTEDVGINCAFDNSNTALSWWAISLIVLGSLFVFVLFAVIIGKVCSKPRSKRNASAAVTSTETAPVQTYPAQAGSMYPPPMAYPATTVTYPPAAGPTAAYPPNTVAYQAYPPTVADSGAAAPPAYTQVAPGNPPPPQK